MRSGLATHTRSETGGIYCLHAYMMHVRVRVRCVCMGMGMGMGMCKRMCAWACACASARACICFRPVNTPLSAHYRSLTAATDGCALAVPLDRLAALPPRSTRAAQAV